MIQYFQTKTTATWANFCVEKEGGLEKDLNIVSMKMTTLLEAIHAISLKNHY